MLFVDFMASRSLLVVDADPAVHAFVAGFLQRQDREIQTVFDGGEALERLRTAPCDLLLAGQGRNGFNGLNLLRRARAIRPATKVILAGEAGPAPVLEAIRERAWSYFHKPLPENPLADMVQQALDSPSRTWGEDIRLLSARPEWVALDIRCKLEAADRATQFLKEIHADLPVGVREDAAAAFRELLLNAIEHGAKSDARKRGRASFIRTSRSLIVHVADPGAGFSFDFLPHAAVSNPADAPIRHVEIRAEHGQRPGGFGILMARNMVDELIYNERGNAVLFVKYLK